MNKIFKILFNSFFFLFIFAMFNREFSFLGLDLRIIGFALGFIILIIDIFNILKKNITIRLEKNDILIFTFFVICIFVNIMWLYNGLEIKNSEFNIILISYLFNFMSFIIFLLNKEYIDIKKFNIYVVISLLFLISSVLAVYFEIDIKKYMFSNCSGKSLDLSKNFLQGKYRISGYAQDPNYTSLFMIFGTAISIYFSKLYNKKIHLLYIILLIFCFLLSASKTVLFAIIGALIVSNLKKLGKLKKIFIPIITILPILLVMFKINVFGSLVTMNQRFKMWEYALDLFYKNPIFGNGLTAFRSYADTVGWWYVQCHSTIFQMLSECGIVAFVIFILIIMNNLKLKNKLIDFITILFTIFMITTETGYHIYFIFSIGILPMIMKEYKNVKEKNNIISN